MDSKTSILGHQQNLRSSTGTLIKQYDLRLERERERERERGGGVCVCVCVCVCC